MKRFAVSLLLVSIVTGLPFQTGTNLRSARSSANNRREKSTNLNVQPTRESDTNKNVNFISVANFCASHPFAGGCEFDEKAQRSGILDDHRLSERNDDENDSYEQVDRTPSLLTVAFFCSSHPSAIGCPDKTFNPDSGDFYNVKILPDIMVRFCILHPTLYGCPKQGVVSSLPSLPFSAPPPPPVPALADEIKQQNLTELPEMYQTVIQPNDVSILTEYFDSEPKLTFDVESLIAEYNYTHGNTNSSEIDDGDQFLLEELTEITGRSVGDANGSETNDLPGYSEKTPDESSQIVQALESTKLTSPKATLSLPPPVDAIFAAGRYASPTQTASPVDVLKRLKMGKMKPLPSVKQLLGRLAL